jgi:hypothetical protein
MVLSMDAKRLPLLLQELRSAQRRCLNVVRTYPDIAFAARRLHLSKAVLLALLDELTEQLGDTAVHVEGGRAYLSRQLCIAVDATGLLNDGTNNSHPETHPTHDVSTSRPSTQS